MFTTQFRRVPLGSPRLSLWWLRKMWFTRFRPSTPSVVVPLSEDTVTRLLDRNDFVVGWPWSYNYCNEILNRRRIECIEHPSSLDWRQIHVRGYDHPDGIELIAHFEPKPRRHPRAHVTRLRTRYRARHGNHGGTTCSPQDRVRPVRFDHRITLRQHHYLSNV